MFGGPKSGGEENAAASRDAAVVDVGSSSVRLVIYRVEGRALRAVHNERSVVRLGQNLSETGRLSANAITRAYNELARYRLLLESRGVDDVTAVATAAVRDAEDGEAFAKEAGRILGTGIRVLSGAEEGKYAAYGVLAAEPSACGVVADLGGSSLELAQIDGAVGFAGDGVTLPLGPLALADVWQRGPDSVRAHIDAVIRKAAVKTEASTLYLLGGACRNLARVRMADTAFPIRTVHGYEMRDREARDLAQKIAQMTPQDVSARVEVSGRRIETLPASAMVVDRLIKHLSIKRVVISGYGLREGVLFAAVRDAASSDDPLLTGVEALVREQGADIAFGRSLERWISPMSEVIGAAFGRERDTLLHNAACRLADAGERSDAVDRGAPLTFNYALHLPVVAISHPERVFLALAVHHRYSGKRLPPHSEPALDLLDRDVHQVALRLGLALRLACELSARSAALLDMTAVRTRQGRIELVFAPGARALVNDTVRRRLLQFGDAANIPTDIVQA